MRGVLCIFVLTGVVRAQSSLTFEDTQLAVDSGLIQVLAADVNGDGKPDLVFLSAARIDVLLGNGDGTFQSPVVTAASGYSTMAAADFNGDGKIDIAAPLVLSGAVFVDTFLGNGDGTFQSPVRSPAGNFYNGTPGVPAVGDVNGDGIPDLIGPGVILLGAGNGTFSKTITTSACDSSSVLGFGGAVTDSAAADFNNNGNLDVALVATETSGGGLFQLELAEAVACLGNGSGTFSAGAIFFHNAGLSPSFSPVDYLVSSGDFNGDGNPDVLILSEYAAYEPPSVFAYSVIFGNGNGTFQSAVTDGPLQSSVAAGNLYLLKPAVVDVNGDGKSDLVQIGGAGVEIFLSNGDGTFRNAASITPQQNPVSIAVADFNGDGLIDILATGASQTTAYINTSLRVSSVENAATLAAGPVAPGSLVAIMGAGIGPATGVSTSAIPWPDSLAGVSVTFNGISAPLSFVSSQQINAQVPWETSGNANVVVTVNGQSTPALQVTTAAIAPGIFATQSGQALAFNSDGTIAGAAGTISGINSHPAVAGDTLTFYVNGLGPVTPAITDGAASSDQLRNAGVTPVFIDSVGCMVQFAGLSPTFVGVDQVNIVVPEGVHGVVPLQINAGAMITPAQVTIDVQ
jgi:uncharacterized protein (TIGR03437 family)